VEQTEPFAKNALGKPSEKTADRPGRNAAETLETEGLSVEGKLGITGGQDAGITFW
jgi:hypothetical protein